MDNFFKKIKELQRIAPSQEFSARSWAVITTTQQIHQSLLAHVWESMGYSLALGLGAIIILVTVGGFSYLNLGNVAPVLVSSLNTKSLLAEAENANFEIKLADAKYLDAASTIVAIALDAVSNNELDHLNSQILEKELESLEKQQDINLEINQVLNKIL